ncbi:hypothetical protein Cs7R123_51740 [Catellatospora sp. TT07R-123]|nr:hypothetical protein Cs7R123_51740 [Catellatospora sp. TT07R-123]
MARPGAPPLKRRTKWLPTFGRQVGPAAPQDPPAPCESSSPIPQEADPEPPVIGSRPPARPAAEAAASAGAVARNLPRRHRPARPPVGRSGTTETAPSGAEPLSRPGRCTSF